jgi:ribokinase
MTIYNLGSINIDLVYRVPHLPGPGETLASTSFSKGLGGKGANMSVAASRAGATCVHIGVIGDDGIWAKERLQSYGVETAFIRVSDQATGNAIIAVDDAAENSIILYPGANQKLTEQDIATALGTAGSGDIFLTQNETNAQINGVIQAKEKGLRVAYAAAPFQAQAVEAVMTQLDMLFLNEVEAQQLQAATGLSPKELPILDVIVTLGARGCRWYHGDKVVEFEAHKVAALDTTGAGDTFTGYVLAALDRGMEIPEAIEIASRASALMVTRLGAADVIPPLAEVEQFHP